MNDIVSREREAALCIQRAYRVFSSRRQRENYEIERRIVLESETETHSIATIESAWLRHQRNGVALGSSYLDEDLDCYAIILQRWIRGVLTRIDVELIKEKVHKYVTEIINQNNKPEPHPTETTRTRVVAQPPLVVPDQVHYDHESAEKLQGVLRILLAKAEVARRRVVKRKLQPQEPAVAFPSELSDVLQVSDGEVGASDQCDRETYATARAHTPLTEDGITDDDVSQNKRSTKATAAILIQKVFRGVHVRKLYQQTHPTIINNNPEFDLEDYEAAAVIIQRAIRSHLTRKKEQKAAVIIQKHLRGHHTRNKITKLAAALKPNISNNKTKERSIIIIQCCFRVFLSKKRVNSLRRERQYDNIEDREYAARVIQNLVRCYIAKTKTTELRKARSLSDCEISKNQLREWNCMIVIQCCCIGYRTRVKLSQLYKNRLSPTLILQKVSRMYLAKKQLNNIVHINNGNHYLLSNAVLTLQRTARVFLSNKKMKKLSADVSQYIEAKIITDRCMCKAAKTHSLTHNSTSVLQRTGRMMISNVSFGDQFWNLRMLKLKSIIIIQCAVRVMTSKQRMQRRSNQTSEYITNNTDVENELVSVLDVKKSVILIQRIAVSYKVRMNLFNRQSAVVLEAVLTLQRVFRVFLSKTEVFRIKNKVSNTTSCSIVTDNCIVSAAEGYNTEATKTHSLTRNSASVLQRTGRMMISNVSFGDQFWNLRMLKLKSIIIIQCAVRVMSSKQRMQRRSNQTSEYITNNTDVENELVSVLDVKKSVILIQRIAVSYKVRMNLFIRQSAVVLEAVLTLQRVFRVFLSKTEVFRIKNKVSNTTSCSIVTDNCIVSAAEGYNTEATKTHSLTHNSTSVLQRTGRMMISNVSFGDQFWNLRMLKLKSIIIIQCAVRVMTSKQRMQRRSNQTSEYITNNTDVENELVSVLDVKKSVILIQRIAVSYKVRMNLFIRQSAVVLEAVLTLQRVFRMCLSKAEVFRTLQQHVQTLQRVGRMYITCNDLSVGWNGRSKRAKQISSCIVIQSAVRTYLSRLSYLEKRLKTTRYIIDKLERENITYKTTNTIPERGRYSTHRDSAAVRIQSPARGMLARDNYHTKRTKTHKAIHSSRSLENTRDRAAVRIQSPVKGMVERSKYSIKKHETLKSIHTDRQLETERDIAAVRIQSPTRGMIEREVFSVKKYNIDESIHSSRTLETSQDKAAVRIQSPVRGMIEREVFSGKKHNAHEAIHSSRTLENTRDRAAVRIQSPTRGMIERGHYSTVKSKTQKSIHTSRQLETTRDVAALRIQSPVRGMIEREKYSATNNQTRESIHSNRQLENTEDTAAVRIQSPVRGMINRIKYSDIKSTAAKSIHDSRIQENELELSGNLSKQQAAIIIQRTIRRGKSVDKYSKLKKDLENKILLKLQTETKTDRASVIIQTAVRRMLCRLSYRLLLQRQFKYIKERASSENNRIRDTAVVVLQLLFRKTLAKMLFNHEKDVATIHVKHLLKRENLYYSSAIIIQKCCRKYLAKSVLVVFRNQYRENDYQRAVNDNIILPENSNRVAITREYFEHTEIVGSGLLINLEQSFRIQLFQYEDLIRSVDLQETFIRSEIIHLHQKELQSLSSATGRLSAHREDANYKMLSSLRSQYELMSVNPTTKKCSAIMRSMEKELLSAVDNHSCIGMQIRNMSHRLETDITIDERTAARLKFERKVISEDLVSLEMFQKSLHQLIKHVNELRKHIPSEPVPPSSVELNVKSNPRRSIRDIRSQLLLAKRNRDDATRTLSKLDSRIVSLQGIEHDTITSPSELMSNQFLYSRTTSALRSVIADEAVYRSLLYWNWCDTSNLLGIVVEQESDTRNIIVDLFYRSYPNVEIPSSPLFVPTPPSPSNCRYRRTGSVFKKTFPFRINDISMPSPQSKIQPLETPPYVVSETDPTILAFCKLTYAVVYPFVSPVYSSQFPFYIERNFVFSDSEIVSTRPAWVACTDTKVEIPQRFCRYCSEYPFVRKMKRVVSTEKHSYSKQYPFIRNQKFVLDFTDSVCESFTYKEYSPTPDTDVRVPSGYRHSYPFVETVDPSARNCKYKSEWPFAVTHGSDGSLLFSRRALSDSGGSGELTTLESPTYPSCLYTERRSDSNIYPGVCYEKGSWQFPTDTCVRIPVSYIDTFPFTLYTEKPKVHFDDVTESKSSTEMLILAETRLVAHQTRESDHRGIINEDENRVRIELDTQSREKQASVRLDNDKKLIHARRRIAWDNQSTTDTVYTRYTQKHTPHQRIQKNLQVLEDRRKQHWDKADQFNSPSSSKRMSPIEVREQIVASCLSHAVSGLIRKESTTINTLVVEQAIALLQSIPHMHSEFFDIFIRNWEVLLNSTMQDLNIVEGFTSIEALPSKEASELPTWGSSTFSQPKQLRHQLFSDPSVLIVLASHHYTDMEDLKQLLCNIARSLMKIDDLLHGSRRNREVSHLFSKWDAHSQGSLKKKEFKAILKLVIQDLDVSSADVDVVVSCPGERVYLHNVHAVLGEVFQGQLRNSNPAVFSKVVQLFRDQLSEISVHRRRSGDTLCIPRMRRAKAAAAAVDAELHMLDENALLPLYDIQPWKDIDLIAKPLCRLLGLPEPVVSLRETEAADGMIYWGLLIDYIKVHGRQLSQEIRTFSWASVSVTSLVKVHEDLLNVDIDPSQLLITSPTLATLLRWASAACRVCLAEHGMEPVDIVWGGKGMPSLSYAHPSLSDDGIESSARAKSLLIRRLGSELFKPSHSHQQKFSPTPPPAKAAAPIATDM